jgi:hypothetical protein
MAVKYTAGKNGLPPVEKMRLLHVYRGKQQMLIAVSQRVDAALAKAPYVDDSVFEPWIEAVRIHGKAEDRMKAKGLF